MYGASAFASAGASSRGRGPKWSLLSVRQPEVGRRRPDAAARCALGLQRRRGRVSSSDRTCGFGGSMRRLRDRAAWTGPCRAAPEVEALPQHRRRKVAGDSHRGRARSRSRGIRAACAEKRARPPGAGRARRRAIVGILSRTTRSRGAQVRHGTNDVSDCLVVAWHSYGLTFRTLKEAMRCYASPP